MFDLDYEIPVGSSAADVAVWMDGDPLTDINGVMRPAMIDSPDYAGADLPD